MNLTNVQEKAVKQLLEEYKIAIQSSEPKIVDFQAPTGSGKTFMLANTINEIIKENNANGEPNKLVFVIATLSSADLPYQMESNLNEYKRYINGLYEVERKESPSLNSQKNKDSTYNLIPQKNKVIIFGVSSFGKNRIFTEQGLLESFLDQIKYQNYTLVYIRDEAHHGGNIKGRSNFKFEDIDTIYDESKLKKEEVRFEYKIQKAANLIIKMTATPKGTHKLVYIDEKDLAEDDIKLLKDELIYNKGITDSSQDLIDDNELLNQACQTFKEVQSQYANNNSDLKNIRPAMLIQVENEPSEKSTAKEKDDFKESIENIIKKLNECNLSYVKYFSNDKVESSSLIKEENHKINLKEISKNDSNVDAIIFKIGPSTGWNIPRACMLVQLRKVSSSSLSIQTIGRIKRFPNPSYNKDQISREGNRYYIYSNAQTKENIRRTLILKREFENEKFVYGQINKVKIKQAIIGADFIREAKNSIVKEKIDEYFKKYHKEYIKNNKKLIGEQGNIENKIRVYSWINNSIELELFINKFLLMHKKIFNEVLIEALNEKYDSIYSKTNIITRNIFWYILIKEYFNTFKLQYAQYIEKIDSTNQLYKILSNKTLPETNEIFIDPDQIEKNNVKLNKTENYAYKDLNDRLHHFDSNPETLFINEAKKIISEYKNEINVKVYTKNPVFHGLKLEYFDEEREIKSSYPDFVFKINNGEVTNYLYIEVKSAKHDYNQQKTKNIVTSYKKYLDNKKPDNALFVDDVEKNNNYTFLICYVDEENQDFYFLGASDNAELDKEVNISIPDGIKELISNKPKFISDIESLFKYFKNNK
ncbi:DEAD/DEAH box helicase family protein [Metamycoplasma hominis]|uniref:DEAD/DEAH box helicase family protein n=1 Tax=Metamycoplasma hominis TaxID=2098 RepID=UPI0015944A24|nr:DEAD/DEAH box helicase family protein [Metamycoplasma hominis]QKX37508.1 DEAD/DEAH box helicase family protein [Metamycoplasma hominis]